MIRNDINHFIEIGPGKVLSGLVKRINREVKINTINNKANTSLFLLTNLDKSRNILFNPLLIYNNQRKFFIILSFFF